MVEIGTKLFLSTGHYKFNGARLCTHVRKTIPIPLVLKFNTLIVLSINNIIIESISPMMRRCLLSSSSNSLSRSHLSDHLVKTPSFFYLSFIFIAHFFASTKVCVSVFHSNLGQCSISTTTFSLMRTFECMQELLLHCRLIFFITWAPFKSFALNLR